MSELKRYGIAGGTGGQTMPFARAVQAADGWLYVSGQTPMVNGEVIEGGIVTQSHQCIQNVMAILREAGYGPEHVCVAACGWMTPATSPRSTGYSCSILANIRRPRLRAGQHGD
jgi:hypothetical protein